MPCSHQVFNLWQGCNFSQIEDLEFLSNYTRLQPATADVFLVITNINTKSIEKQIVVYDIKSTCKYFEEHSTVDKVLLVKNL